MALTILTVVPVRAGPVDRAAAGAAMTLAPAVGLGLGALCGAAGIGLRAIGGPPILVGAVVIALGVLLTRGLHLDGLADTADGLGSYHDREGALEVMRKPDIGPFGVVAITLALLLQAAAAASVLGRAWPAAVAGVAAAAGTGRVAATWACRRGIPAARPSGLGAMVAGTVGWPAAIAALVAVALVAVLAVPGRPWQGPFAVIAGLAAALALTRHAVRRLGGVTGDVLGAAVEVATTVAYAVLALA